MAQRLGILVTSDEHMSSLLGIARAANRAGKEVMVFITHEGVRLTQLPEFAQLEGLADIKICEVNFAFHGLEKPAPLLEDEDYTNQAANGMMIEDVDRYLVL